MDNANLAMAMSWLVFALYGVAVIFGCFVVFCVGYLLARLLSRAVWVIFRTSMVLYQLLRGRFYCRHCSQPARWHDLFAEEGSACLVVPRCLTCGQVFNPYRQICFHCGSDLQESLDECFPEIRRMRRQLQPPVASCHEIFPAALAWRRRQQWN